jgi:hypothetical protein
MTMMKLCKGQTSLEARDDIVQVTVRCNDHYEAMLLYDKMVEEAKNGSVIIHIKTKPESVMEKT